MWPHLCCHISLRFFLFSLTYRRTKSLESAVVRVVSRRPDYHRRGLVSISGQSMWDLRLTNWLWVLRFSYVVITTPVTHIHSSITFDILGIDIRRYVRQNIFWVSALYWVLPVCTFARGRWQTWQSKTKKAIFSSTSAKGLCKSEVPNLCSAEPGLRDRSRKIK